MSTLPSTMKTLLHLSARPIVLHYALPILMIYLVIGTVAQKYIGLYQATQMFFSSLIFWWGPVPLPSLSVFLVIIFVNLAAKLILKSPWRKQNSGIIITHIGAGLLLAGGLITALYSSEGYIDLAPGETKSYVADYHIRELVVVNEQDKTMATFLHKDLSDQQTLSAPFTFTVLNTCENCAITAREEATSKHQSMAQHMQLSPAPLRHNDEDNLAGVTLSIDDKIYVVLEDIPQTPEITIHDQTYRIILRQQQRALPFTIELLAFKKDTHPGTDIARSYQSTVRITDGTAQWESIIRMNEPLRYKGYTFYQSSFIATPTGHISVLSAVWNIGRSFPYISGILMCLGMIVHVFVRRPRRPADA